MSNLSKIIQGRAEWAENRIGTGDDAYWQGRRDEAEYNAFLVDEALNLLVTSLDYMLAEARTNAQVFEYLTEFLTGRALGVSQTVDYVKKRLGLED